MGAPTFAVGCDAGIEAQLLCRSADQAVFVLDAQEASKAGEGRRLVGTGSCSGGQCHPGGP